MIIKKEDEGYWNILLNDKVVGSIQESNSFGLSATRKSLYVNDTLICYIKNQKEALEKLNEFFQNNKNEIETVKSLIEKINEDVELVKNEISKSTLSKAIDELNVKLIKLKSFDLIN